MNKRKSRKSAGLSHVVHVWENAPTRSWQTFNGALASALDNAISSNMRFDAEDFSWMSSELRLGRWCGDLERFYANACGSDRGSGNPSAVAALEAYFEREPFIWAEKTKTPTRLYVGAEFTWKGERVTVTSFNDEAKSLTACSYKAVAFDDEQKPEAQVGSITYALNDYRRVESFKSNDDGSVVLRLSAPQERQTADILHRYTITVADLKSVRADYDRRRRWHEAAFAAATTLADLETARLAASEEGASAYRHFDLEILTQAHGDAQKRIRESMSAAKAALSEKQRLKLGAERLEKWVAGEDVRDYLTTEIRVRVKGDFVEVSNGNRVSVDTARRTLSFVKRYRAKGWQRNGQNHEVEGFQLERVNQAGVQIGCTLFPWPEVDRCAKLLRSVKPQA